MSNEKVKTFLVNALPDIADEVDDRLVEAVAEEMGRWWHPQYQQALGVEPDAAWVPRYADPPRCAGYRVRATHTRHTAAGRHEFVGEVPMVRVPLPAKHEALIASTPIGEVVDGDHKLYCLDVFRAYYKGYLGFMPHRVDLITPVRAGGHRFAAVAIYLVYDHNGALMSYVFEAGMATGKPMVLYASKDMGPILRRGGYKPTPFSSVDHWYLGELFLGDSFDPVGFRIDIFDEAAKPSSPFAVHRDNAIFSLSATMERVDDIAAVAPLSLTLQAALRVAAIADARGESIPDLGLAATRLLAMVGRTLDWKHAPEPAEEP